jgi:hypothetical protein
VVRLAELVWSAAFSNDGQRLVTGRHGLTARVWDVATGRKKGSGEDSLHCVRNHFLTPFFSFLIPFSLSLFHRALKEAYKILFIRKLTQAESLAALRAMSPFPESVRQLADFIEKSDRGIVRRA